MDSFWAFITIKQGNSEKGIHNYKNILRILHSNANIIFPTRNPVNLVRSWMHYQKDIINEYMGKQRRQSKGIIKITKGSREEEFYQTFKVVSDQSEKDILINGFKLDPLKENISLTKYIKKVIEYKYMVPAWSLSLQLFYRSNMTILKALKQGNKINIQLDKAINKANLVICNCDNYSDNCKKQLDQILGKDFSKTLIKTRENVSNKESSNVKCELSDFQTYYKNRFKCEFDIFEY